MRTCFQRDRDRVIHCSSFRRLEYKTQVFVNHEGDNYRTRLTHSLEGAQIGRTVARAMGLNEELTECLVLGHDLGHTPFGHSGERVMNELMRDHGGFEHNRQTLRILEVLERRYPEFPGLNLTWEVREGIIKHRPDTDATAPPEYAPGEAPTLEAQLVDYVDEIAYNNHDVDDGLSLGHVHGRADPRGDALPRGARRRPGAGASRTSASPGTTWCAGSSTAACATSSRRARPSLAAARVESVADVRGAGRRLVAYSPEMAARVRELKDFLFRNMYRHYRVVRMGDKAGRLLRDLFESYVGEPRQLPPALPGPARAGRRPPRRLRLHRRHDRPLRGGRAPEALRPDGAGLTAVRGRSA